MSAGYGCQTDFLEEEAIDFIVDTNFWQTKEDAFSGVNATYNALISSSIIMRYVTEVEMWSDCCDGRTGNSALAGSFHHNEGIMDRREDIWKQFYTVVNRSNLAILNIPDIPQFAEQDQLLGEGYFLRAFCYFNIVRLWDAVPLRVNPVNSLDEINITRTPVTIIYEQIISDLNEAKNKLPDSNEMGRVDKNAALTLLAAVHLNRGNWAEAKSYAKEVINSGAYRLADSFEVLFDADVPATEELIFFVRMASELGQSNYLVPYLQHWDNPEASTGWAADIGNKKSYLSTWDDADLRKSWSIYDKTTPLINENGDTVYINSENIHFNKYRDPYWESGISLNFPFLRYADVLLIYSEADIKDDGTLSNQGLEYWNMVRRRGYGKDINSVSSIDILTGLSKDDYLELLLDERGKEFLFETKRWYDLKRFNKVQEKITEAGYEYNDWILLWPIPTDEINNNELINQEDQNPGY